MIPRLIGAISIRLGSVGVNRLISRIGDRGIPRSRFGIIILIGKLLPIATAASAAPTTPPSAMAGARLAAVQIVLTDGSIRPRGRHLLAILAVCALVVAKIVFTDWLGVTWAMSRLA